MSQGITVIHNQVAGIAEGECLQQYGDDKHERGNASPQIRKEEHIDQGEAEHDANQ